MQASDKMLNIEAIKQLKARYFRFMDTKDHAGLSTVFTHDAIFDARASLVVDVPNVDIDTLEESDWVHKGGQKIADFVREATAPFISVHHGHCHEIELISDTVAKGVIAMEDKIFYADQTPPKLFLNGWGHYVETYRKESGKWQIATSRLTRLLVEIDPDAQI